MPLLAFLLALELLELPSEANFFSAFSGLPGFFRALLFPPFGSISFGAGGPIYMNIGPHLHPPLLLQGRQQSLFSHFSSCKAHNVMFSLSRSLSLSLRLPLTQSADK